MNEKTRYIFHRLFTNPSAVLGMFLLLVFVTVALAAPYLAPPKYEHNPYRMPHKGYSPTPKPPGEGRILGTTSGQYDIYYGVVWGTRTAFKIGLIVVGVSVLVGVILGTVSGYYGGLLDELLMRFVDIVFAVPLLVLAMAVVVAFGRGIDNIIIALSLIVWRNYVRVMRSGVLTIVDNDYVNAAKLMGASGFRIMCTHIIPNAVYPVMVVAAMDMGAMVITASFMSFLGLGAPRGYADWGQMVALARNYIIGPPGDPLKYWYTIVFPGGAVVLFVLAWNLVGDALRDALDPRLKNK